MDIVLENLVRGRTLWISLNLLSVWYMSDTGRMRPMLTLLKMVKDEVDY